MHQAACNTDAGTHWGGTGRYLQDWEKSASPMAQALVYLLRVLLACVSGACGGKIGVPILCVGVGCLCVIGLILYQGVCVSLSQSCVCVRVHLYIYHLGFWPQDPHTETAGLTAFSCCPFCPISAFHMLRKCMFLNWSLAAPVCVCVRVCVCLCAGVYIWGCQQL